MAPVIERIAALKIIPVVAIERAEDASPLGRALMENGLPAAEITFRTPAAAQAILRLRREQPGMLIGAGTVLNYEQAHQARESGASFIVSPGFNPSTVAACRELDIPFIPGVNNPSAIEAALELGITTLKFFPAEASGGLRLIRALLDPYNQLRLIPTGGINLDNIRDYLAVPGVIACGGSWMVSKKLLADQRWDEVGRLVREVVARVSEI